MSKVEATTRGARKKEAKKTSTKNMKSTKILRNKGKDKSIAHKDKVNLKLILNHPMDLRPILKLPAVATDQLTESTTKLKEVVLTLEIVE